MSQQLHAPATPEELDAMPERTGTIEPKFWAEDGGWCSACRHTGRRISCMGTDDRYVGICTFCLGKLADVARAPAAPNGGQSDGR